MIAFLHYTLLFNALMAVLFAIFYELVMACNDFHISPWWAAVPYAAGVILYVRFELKQATDTGSKRL